MKEHHLKVPRSARYFTLGDLSQAPEQVWYVCHGYRQLASRFLRRFVPLDDGTRWVVAPEGLSRFYVDPAPGRHGPQHRVGASWMTREDRETEIRDYVRYLDRLAATVEKRRARAGRLPRGGHGSSTDPKLGPPGTTPDRPSPDRRPVVLGFSQGVHTVARWVVLGGIRPSRLVLWGAYLPPDLDMARAIGALADVDLVLVRGRADPTVEDLLHEEQGRRLERHGIVFRSLEHPGGHEIDEEVLLELAGPPA